MYVTLQSVSTITNRTTLKTHVNAGLEKKKTEYIPKNTITFQQRTGSNAL